MYKIIFSICLMFLGFAQVEATIASVAEKATDESVFRFFDLTGESQSFDLKDLNPEKDNFGFNGYLIDKHKLYELKKALLSDDFSISDKIVAENRWESIKICRNEERDTVENGKKVKAFNIVKGDMIQELVEKLNYLILIEGDIPERSIKRDIPDKGDLLAFLSNFSGTETIITVMDKAEAKRIQELIEECKVFFNDGNLLPGLSVYKTLEIIKIKIGFKYSLKLKEGINYCLVDERRGSRNQFKFIIKNYFSANGKYVYGMKEDQTEYESKSLVDQVISPKIVKTKDVDGDDQYEVHVVRQDPTNLLKSFNHSPRAKDELNMAVNNYLNFILHNNDREEVRRELARWNRSDSEYIAELDVALEKRDQVLEEQVAEINRKREFINKFRKSLS